MFKIGDLVWFNNWLNSDGYSTDPFKITYLGKLSNGTPYAQVEGKYHDGLRFSSGFTLDVLRHYDKHIQHNEEQIRKFPNEMLPSSIG